MSALFPVLFPGHDLYLDHLLSAAVVAPPQFCLLPLAAAAAAAVPQQICLTEVYLSEKGSQYLQ